MSIETLGEAWRLGWRVTARCAFGNRDGMKSIGECTYRAELNMQTLVWSRGPNFPLSRLESGLMCPECGSRRDTRRLPQLDAEVLSSVIAADGPWSVANDRESAMKT